MLGLQRLGEKVGPVVSSLDEGDRDALLLDKLTNEEVSTRDVLRLRVELGVVGDGDTSLVESSEIARDNEPEGNTSTLSSKIAVANEVPMTWTRAR